MLDREFFLAGKGQPAVFQVFPHQAGKPRLENAHMALLQQAHLVFVNVHADHIVTDLGQYGGLYQANVTTTKYADFHGAFLGLVLPIRRS